MEIGFDPVAKKYADSIKELPESYLQLIAYTFKLNTSSKIIDMGCGTGLLTVPLSKYSDHVCGIDISHNMIAIAKSQPNEHKIDWIENDVDRFEFHNSYYDLIISYESFHLFPNTLMLLQKCANGLKKSGYICMGWCYFNWELLLENEIVSTFKQHGIEWGEWSYQKFLVFQKLIDSQTIVGLSPTRSKQISVYQEWNVVEIVKYITSISKAIGLTAEESIVIQNELAYLITQKYGNVIKGETQFWIRYSQKR